MNHYFRAKPSWDWARGSPGRIWQSPSDKGQKGSFKITLRKPNTWILLQWVWTWEQSRLMLLLIQINNTDNKQPDILCVCVSTFKPQLPLSVGGVPLHRAREQRLGEPASCTPQSPLSVKPRTHCTRFHPYLCYEALGGAHNLAPSWKEGKGENFLLGRFLLADPLHWQASLSPILLCVHILKGDISC